MSDEDPNSPAEPPSSPAPNSPPSVEKPGVVRTALLVAGSAVFGGIAVALWHRRTLAKMRQNPAEPPAAIPPPEEGSTLD